PGPWAGPAQGGGGPARRGPGWPGPAGPRTGLPPRGARARTPSGSRRRYRRQTRSRRTPVIGQRRAPVVVDERSDAASVLLPPAEGRQVEVVVHAEHPLRAASVRRVRVEDPVTIAEKDAQAPGLAAREVGQRGLDQLRLAAVVVLDRRHRL